MTKKLFWLPAISVLAMPFVHPFGPVRQQRSSNALPEVPSAIERACQNCHSQRTQWPLYSHLPLVSWALEKDVAEARQHLDLSRWAEYSLEDKRDLLARIGTEVRNRRMPLPRYLLLHPEARLSDAEIQGIYEWTKAQRRAARNERE
jgi:cytochrome c